MPATMSLPASRFPARLKELRNKAGLTQAQLAKLAGMSQQAITDWENGKREPGWAAVVALAAALGVDCAAFLEEPAAPDEGEEEAPPPPKRGRPRKDAD